MGPKVHQRGETGRTSRLRDREWQERQQLLNSKSLVYSSPWLWDELQPALLLFGKSELNENSLATHTLNLGVGFDDSLRLRNRRPYEQGGNDERMRIV